MFTKNREYVSLSTENENKIVDTSTVTFEYDDLDSVQVATLVTSLLYKKEIIQPDDEKGFVFTRPFKFVMTGFESWMGLSYPDFEKSFSAGDSLETFKEMQHFKDQVRDYR